MNAAAMETTFFAVRDQLLAGDAPAAAEGLVALEGALKGLGQLPPAQLVRMRALYEECLRAADALGNRLTDSLRQSATSRRASHAYEQEQVR